MISPTTGVLSTEPVIVAASSANRTTRPTIRSHARRRPTATSDRVAGPGTDRGIVRQLVDVVPVRPHPVAQPPGGQPGASPQLAEVGADDVDVPELAAGPEGLAVQVHLDVGEPGRQVVHPLVHAHRRSRHRRIRRSAQHIAHHDERRDLIGAAERVVQDCPQVLLELAGHRPVHRPVPGVVRAHRELVDDQPVGRVRTAAGPGTVRPPAPRRRRDPRRSAARDGLRPRRCRRRARVRGRSPRRRCRPAGPSARWARRRPGRTATGRPGRRVRAAAGRRIRRPAGRLRPGRGPATASASGESTTHTPRPS